MATVAVCHLVGGGRDCDRAGAHYPVDAGHQDHTRLEHSTEAFTWTTSALLAGGIGLAAGGVMLEQLPATAALGTGAMAALAAAAGARFVLGR
jgi:hypothetical protein